MLGKVKSMFTCCFAPGGTSRASRTSQGPRAESPGASTASHTGRNPLSGTRPGSTPDAGPGPVAASHDKNAFAGYLMARAAMHRKIDNTPDIAWKPNGAMEKQGDSLTRLKAANDTVDETRALLPYGRGNVTVDNERTRYQSSMRDEAAMHLLEENSPRGEDPQQLTAAMFRFTKAARCGGSAPIATHLHGEKLEGSYRVRTVEGERVDHTYTEVVRKDGRRKDDPIIDPWCDGPAVLREDARYGDAKVKTLHQLDATTGPQAAKNVERLTARLEGDEQQQRLLKYYTGTSDMDYHSDGYKRLGTEFDPRPVYHPDFVKAAGKALHGQGGHPSMAGMPRHPQLTQEIQAVGVALSLNGGPTVDPASSGKIRDALAQAPGIIESAKRQFPPQDR